jgi:hypothetical protein
MRSLYNRVAGQSVEFVAALSEVKAQKSAGMKSGR